MAKLSARFIKPELMHKDKSNNLSYSKLQISIQNQLDDSDIGIGIITRYILRKLLDDEGISNPQIVNIFYDGVKSFLCMSILILR